jgi:DNA-binding transcriptional MerR regulator
LVKVDYTLADLARASRAKRRSLQLWADAGIIRAYSVTERKGTGTHRLFSRDEVIIASILNVFSRRQVAIGELQRLATAVRKFLDSGEKRVLLEEAIEGQPRFLIVSWDWPNEIQMPLVNLGGLDDLDEILGMELGQEFTTCVLISLHHCLANLKS